MKYIILIILILAGLWYFQQNSTRGLDVNKEKLPVRAQNVISQAKPSPQIKDIQKLNGEFFSASDKEVKAFLCRLISLGFLAKDPNSFRRFKLMIEKKYSNENYFSFLDNEFPEICDSCTGNGGGECKKCDGEGACRNRKCEEGKIRYKSFDDKVEEKDCFICRGEGKCKYCTGTGVADTSCSTCLGSGRKNSKAKAARLYKETLKRYN